MDPLNSDKAIRIDIGKKTQQVQQAVLEDNPTEATVKFDFAFDWARALTSGFDVNVTVADVNGNGNCTETHIDGLVEGLIKALISAWNAFVEAVKEIASAAFEWIWDAISGMFDSTFITIREQCESWLQEFLNIISTIIDNENNDEAQLWLDFLSHPISLTMIMIPVILLAIDTILKPFYPIVVGIMILVMGFIVPLFFIALGLDNYKVNTPDITNYDASIPGITYNNVIDKITAALQNQDTGGRAELIKLNDIDADIIPAIIGGLSSIITFFSLIKSAVNYPILWEIVTLIFTALSVTFSLVSNHPAIESIALLVSCFNLYPASILYFSIEFAQRPIPAGISFSFAIAGIAYCFFDLFNTEG